MPSQRACSKSLWGGLHPRGRKLQPLGSSRGSSVCLPTGLSGLESTECSLDWLPASQREELLEQALSQQKDDLEEPLFWLALWALRGWGPVGLLSKHWAWSLAQGALPGWWWCAQLSLSPGLVPGMGAPLSAGPDPKALYFLIAMGFWSTSNKMNAEVCISSPAPCFSWQYIFFVHLSSTLMFYGCSVW